MRRRFLPSFRLLFCSIKKSSVLFFVFASHRDLALLCCFVVCGVGHHESFREGKMYLLCFCITTSRRFGGVVGTMGIVFSLGFVWCWLGLWVLWCCIVVGLF